MNKNIQILFFLLFIFIQELNLQAQNLVPNPSFENINYCPPYYNDIVVLQNWQNPTNGSPNIFNACNNTNAGVPGNTFGNQFALEGNGYIGLILYLNNINAREYFQVELLQPLVSNTKYKISFYVSLADSSRWGINNIGLYFSQNSFFVNTLYSLNYSPQILSSIIITDISTWTLISESYQAIGGEKFITIGNFMDNANTDTLCINPNYNPTINSAYYYIDNVFVGLDTTVHVNESVLLGNDIKIYPNPAKDKIIITNNDNYSEEIEVTISNITGQRIIFEKFQSQSQNQKEINISKLINDIYILKIQSGIKIEYKKLIKQ